MQKRYDDIRALGAELVAISPQLPELNAEVKRKHRLAFPVLHDQGNAYSKTLSLVYTLPDDLCNVYQNFGIDLPSNHGEDAWELPLATRMVVDRDGVIRSVDADPDYTIRPEPEGCLEVLKTVV